MCSPGPGSHSVVVLALFAMACTAGLQAQPARAAAAPSTDERNPAMAKSPNPCKAPRTAAQLREAARSSLGAEVVWADLAPLLPGRWPAAGGGVAYWTYRSEALPSGMVRYRVRGPLEKVSFTSLGGPVDVRRLGPGQVLGIDEEVEPPPLDEQRLLQAEQAVVDVVAGCRDAETARTDLALYLDWVQLHPLVGKDLETRAPAFFEWLRAKAPPR
jgi:hypothetical protein